MWVWSTMPPIWKRTTVLLWVPVSRWRWSRRCRSSPLRGKPPAECLRTAGTQLVYRPCSPHRRAGVPYEGPVEPGEAKVVSLSVSMALGLKHATTPDSRVSEAAQIRLTSLSSVELLAPVSRCRAGGTARSRLRPCDGPRPRRHGPPRAAASARAARRASRRAWPRPHHLHTA